MEPRDVEEFYEDFGHRVRAAREEAQLTQEDLGKLLGLTRSSIANIEAGRQRVLLHTIVLIAQGTGVPTQDLMPTPVAPLASVLVPAHLRGLSGADREVVEKVMRQTLRTSTEDAKAAG